MCLVVSCFISILYCKLLHWASFGSACFVNRSLNIDICNVKRLLYCTQAHNGNVKDMKEVASASKHSLPEYVIQAFELVSV